MADYSMTKLEFVNIMMERKIREKMSGRTVVNKYQVVIGECWESKFNYKPNWDDCSAECKLEKGRLQQTYNRVIAKYVANSKGSIRPLSFGISNDVLVSTEKYPILFKKPEPVTESQKKYCAKPVIGTLLPMKGRHNSTLLCYISMSSGC